MYACLSDYPTYATDEFQRNHPDWPWNFGLRNIDIFNRTVLIDPLDTARSPFSETVQFVGGTFDGIRFDVGGFSEYFNSAPNVCDSASHVFLAMDDRLVLSVTYNFGDTSQILPHRICSNFEFKYREGIIGFMRTNQGYLRSPKLRVNEFHNDPRIFQLLSNSSKAIDKIVADREKGVDTFLADGARDRDAEKRKKFTL